MKREYNSEVTLEAYHQDFGWQQVGSPIKVTKDTKMVVHVENFAVDDSVKNITIISNGVGSVNVQYVKLRCQKV